MDMTDERLAFPKHEPRAVVKKRKQKLDAKDEREAREIVRKRDAGRCRVPNCHERGAELHHIVFRSRSRRLRWDPRNLVTLCRDHHALLHAGIITITGNADEEIVISGDTERLKFRL